MLRVLKEMVVFNLNGCNLFCFFKQVCISQSTLTALTLSAGMMARQDTLFC